MRIVLGVFAVVISVSAAVAQPMPGLFSFPPPGTEIETSGEAYRVESVSGFDAVVVNKRTNVRIGVHANLIAGSMVGNVLQYDKRIVESLWPLEVGKKIQFDSNREGMVWTRSIEVLRTETVTVPAGTYFTYVVESHGRGIGHNIYRGTTTQWYAPALGFPVRYREVVAGESRAADWEVLRIIAPDGTSMIRVDNLPTPVVAPAPAMPTVVTPAPVVAPATAQVAAAAAVSPQDVSAVPSPAMAPFAYPPVGPDLETSAGTFRIASVNGYDAVILDRQSGRTHGVHAGVMEAPGVGLDLKYRKSALEQLWPLAVGKTVQFDTERDRVIRSVRIRVLRTETVTVPAGTFSTYVLEIDERGVTAFSTQPSSLTSPSKTTRWYAPEIATTVKYRRRGETAGSATEWELRKVIRPDGTLMAFPAQPSTAPAPIPRPVSPPERAPAPLAPAPPPPAVSARPVTPPIASPGPTPVPPGLSVRPSPPPVSAPALAPAPSPSVPNANVQDPAARLQVLQGLLDRGLITREEYLVRRQRILDSL
jgi:hypothetical protein